MDVLCNASGLVANPARPPTPLYRDNNGELSPHNLLKQGSYIEAVLETSRLIPQCSEDESPARVLGFWYVRIQSLLTLQLGHHAAEEIANNLSPLEAEDFVKNQLKTPEDKIKAWELRLLLVPVKTKGINQSAMQQYYTLGFEARQEAATNSDSEVISEWLSAVKIAGLYTLSTLIALRDYMTAIHFLRTHHKATKDPHMAQILALLHIIIGDTLGSQAWSAEIKNPEIERQIHDLRKFADGDTDYDSGSSDFSGIWSVYQGHISSGIAKLEEKALSDRSTHGVLNNTSINNLFVLYDLCFSDSRQHRAAFTKRLRETNEPGKLESIELSAEFSQY